jgi:hypothetical protein
MPAAGNLPSAVADSGVFSNLVAGTYTIWATDINGCSLDTTVTIFQHSELVVMISTIPSSHQSRKHNPVASGGTALPYSIDNRTTCRRTDNSTPLAAPIGVC